MGYDLRSEVIRSIQQLGYNGLSFIGLVSRLFLEEKRQLDGQQGPIKRTFVWDYIGNLGHIVGIATKYIRDKIRLQRLFLIGSDGKTIIYKFLPEREYGALHGLQTVERVEPEVTVNRILLEAYGLSKQ